MNYEELKKRGNKITEEDFVDGLYHAYAGTTEYWECDGVVYDHTMHTNGLVYTGHTDTRRWRSVKKLKEEISANYDNPFDYTSDSVYAVFCKYFNVEPKSKVKGS